jgi:hypothetical protein
MVMTCGESNDYSVGALAGLNQGTIKNCSSSGPVQGSSCIGGLVGFNEGTITSSSSGSNVTGLNGSDGLFYIGGLVGFNSSGRVEKSFATGNVNGGGGFACGGLVGYSYSLSIINCYATGAVTGSYGDSGGGMWHGTGGLVGSNHYGIVSCCYATGQVTISGTAPSNTATYFGGLIGFNMYTNNVEFSYYDITATKMNDSGKGEGKITTAMKVDTPYDYNWLSSVWSFTINSCPTLKP